MGLLDDAIREHLELKKRRGADPDEVARQEEEALGPPRRAEFADQGTVEDEPLPAGELGPEDFPEQEAGAVADAPGPVEDQPWLEEPISAVDQPTAPFVPPDVEEEPPPAPPARPREEADGTGVPATEEDVLEETPDFLSETPEHDRLWFEQRPPRDFDFDD